MHTSGTSSAGDPLTHGCNQHADVLQRIPAHCCFKGADADGWGPKETGFCLDAASQDVNSGVSSGPEHSGVSDDACLAWCKTQPSATGCERISNQGNAGCYVHRGPVAHGSGAANHVCWVARPGMASECSSCGPMVLAVCPAACPVVRNCGLLSQKSSVHQKSLCLVENSKEKHVLQGIWMRLGAEKGWEGRKMGDGVTACGWRVLYRTQVRRPWYLLWCDCGSFRFLKLFCPETGQEVRQVERRHREAAQVRARPSGGGEGGLPRGLGHNLLTHFSSLGSSTMEISETDFFDILTIQNDQISYIKHVLAPLDVFSPYLDVGGGGLPRGLGHNLLMQFSSLGSSRMVVPLPSWRCLAEGNRILQIIFLIL